jgi:hypothetical protein
MLTTCFSYFKINVTSVSTSLLIAKNKHMLVYTQEKACTDILIFGVLGSKRNMSTKIRVEVDETDLRPCLIARFVIVTASRGAALVN